MFTGLFGSNRPSDCHKKSQLSKLTLLNKPAISDTPDSKNPLSWFCPKQNLVTEFGGETTPHNINIHIVVYVTNS